MKNGYKIALAKRKINERPEENETRLQAQKMRTAVRRTEQTQ